jgi:hypothetical protein
MASDISKWRGIPRDTSPEAYWIHREALRQLGTAGRLRLAFDISEQMWRTAKAGIRRRHPDYSDEKVQLALVRMRLGEELFRIRYPDEEVSP